MLTLRDCRLEGYGADVENLPRRQIDAAASGIRYFYTGKPCKHGHVGPRYTAGGSCAICTRTNNAKRAGREFEGIGNRAKQNASRVAAYKISNKIYEGRPCKLGHTTRFTASANCVECNKISAQKRKDQAKYKRIEKEYGLTKEEYARFVLVNGGACAICLEKPTRKSAMHVDHCHKTGRLRGFLCSRCNQALGLMRDNIDLLKKAIEYLK